MKDKQTTEDQIRSRLEKRIEELEAKIKQLEKIIRKLDRTTLTGKQ
jgi:ferritin-like metal-binding protein YciE